MRLSPLPLVLALLLPVLAGCSHIDWDDLTSFGGSDDAADTPAAAAETQTAQNAPAPAAAGPAGPNAFCMAVAKQDATGNGFDTATQQRVLVRNYQQCVATFGNTAGK